MEYADAARRYFGQLTKCPVCGRATFCRPHSRSPVWHSRVSWQQRPPCTYWRL